MLEEALMQAPPADRAVGRVDCGTYLSLGGRQPHRRLGIPAGIAVSETLDRRGESGEHGVNQPVRERRRADVPIQQQPAAQLGDLGIQQHLSPCEMIHTGSPKVSMT